MSWTQVFPVLTDEMVSEYLHVATKEERREAREWFRVERVLHAQERAHVVPYALFWKPTSAVDADSAVPTRALVRRKDKAGTVGGLQGKSFHEREVLPLLRGARALGKKRGDVVVRVYLAKDLEFLAEELAAAGCEVAVMASSSLRHSPGALWRLLALGEKGRVVTMGDATYSARTLADIERTDAMLRAGLGLWRLPHCGELDGSGESIYRPISRSQFGAVGGFPIVRLAEALIWQTQRGGIPTLCTPPGGCGTLRVAGSRWPDYGFDEWFLLAALYPRAARKGVLTLADAARTSRVLPLDVEYATWANPRSEVVYFGEAGQGCCPATGAAAKKKGVKILRREVPYWDRWEKLPLLMNLLGLRGSAVKIGARNGEHSAEFLSAWKGKKWHVVEQWKPRPKIEWVDSENFQTQAEWDVARSAFDKTLRREKRVAVIEKTSAAAAKQFAAGSLDLVWLNEDRSYLGTLAAIERWWPLLRDGGIMAGVGCVDRFQGSPYGAHSWHATHSALKEWRRKTGHGFYLTVDGKDGWIMFKTKLPRPEDVLIISGATKEVTYAAATTANHRAYCERWGYRYHLFGEEGFDRSRDLQWSKILMMKTALKWSKWVIWLDCDAVFADWTQPISRLCLDPFEMICTIWTHAETVRPSSGVFMMKSGAWAQKFLADVWRYPRHHRKLFHEEEALWSVLKRSPKLLRGLFAVPNVECNSPSTFEGKASDPLLHFLFLKETRTPILQDVCRMIEERHRAG